MHVSFCRSTMCMSWSLSWVVLSASVTMLARYWWAMSSFSKESSTFCFRTLIRLWTFLRRERQWEDKQMNPNLKSYTNQYLCEFIIYTVGFEITLNVCHWKSNVKFQNFEKCKTGYLIKKRYYMYISAFTASTFVKLTIWTTLYEHFFAFLNILSSCRETRIIKFVEFNSCH